MITKSELKEITIQKLINFAMKQIKTAKFTIKGENEKNSNEFLITKNNISFVTKKLIEYDTITITFKFKI